MKNRYTEILYTIEQQGIKLEKKVEEKYQGKIKTSWTPTGIFVQVDTVLMTVNRAVTRLIRCQRPGAGK